MENRQNSTVVSRTFCRCVDSRLSFVGMVLGLGTCLIQDWERDWDSSETHTDRGRHTEYRYKSNIGFNCKVVTSCKNESNKMFTKMLVFVHLVVYNIKPKK